ncbi:Transmembrane_domain-containing protein [Hexamita inflata]|uniref:Transmembrane domain-containing protein n=1 Tax=Hexamita inflata TaxID=28002 RepID=A0AA86NWG6_9EUKA|nr:Transmembrane domain-containing protein [Hexamita inflata]
MSGYIQLDELTKHKVNNIKIKQVGFLSLCCSYCCLLTGFTGIIFLSVFSLCLYRQIYFEADLQFTQTEQKPDTEEYNTKALIFIIGAALEAIVFVLSIFWVKRNNKISAAAKLAKEQK